MHPTSLLIHQYSTGLCNRLRAIAGLRSVADIRRVKPKLCWEPRWDCPAEYAELFQPCCEMVSPEEALRLREQPDCVVFHGDRGKRSATLGANLYGYLVPRAVRSAFLRRILYHIRHLQLIEPLQTALEQFVATWPANVIGVHVRRTDHSRKFNATASDRYLLQRMAKVPNDISFFLATDNPVSQAMVCDAFPGRVICYNTTFNEEFRQTPVGVAAIELYALARTQRIFGSLVSSFTDYASMLGGIPVERY